MLKFIKNTSMLVALCLSTNSFAGIITDTVAQNVKVHPTTTSCGWFCTTTTNGSHSYTHNILDDGFVLGSALSGNLDINLYDDGDWFSSEKATISINDFDLGANGTWGGNYFTVTPGWAQDLQVNALVALNSNGFLDVTISGIGDFYVGDSVLTVTTQDAVAAVSEPATLALLGLGLMGLGFSRRKQTA